MKKEQEPMRVETTPLPRKLSQVEKKQIEPRKVETTHLAQEEKKQQEPMKVETTHTRNLAQVK